jgi:hypothetical protein
MIDGPMPDGYGLPVSSVHSSPRAFRKHYRSQGAFRCPAPRQGMRCLDCRACWNGDVHHVSYLHH